MNPTKRNYRATFIIDNRGKEESVDQIIDGVKQVITAVQGDVIAVDNIGRRDQFGASPPHPSGHPGGKLQPVAIFEAVDQRPRHIVEGGDRPAAVPGTPTSPPRGRRLAAG